MTRRGYIGGAAPTSLAAGIASGDTSMTAQDLATWSGITTNGPFTVTIHRDYPNEEQILVAAINTTTGVMSSVTRNYAGSTAVAHSAGESLEVTSTYLDFDEANAHINTTTLDHHTQYARTDMSRVLTGSVKATAHDHFFGAHANSGAGSSVHIGDFSDTVAGYVAAEGATADISLVLRSKGAGSLFFQNDAGATKVQLTPAGQVEAIGVNHFLGTSALGASGTHLHVLSTSTTAVGLYADGSGSNVDLVARSKGSGAIYLQDAAGTTLLQSITPVSDDDVGVLLAIKQGGVVSVKNVYQMAADSAGTGKRILAVGN